MRRVTVFIVLPFRLALPSIDEDDIAVNAAGREMMLVFGDGRHPHWVSRHVDHRSRELSGAYNGRHAASMLWEEILLTWCKKFEGCSLKRHCTGVVCT